MASILLTGGLISPCPNLEKQVACFCESQVAFLGVGCQSSPTAFQQHSPQPRQGVFPRWLYIGIEVRSLSRRKVLCHFMQLLFAVHMLLEEKGQYTLLSLLNEDMFIDCIFDRYNKPPKCTSSQTSREVKRKIWQWCSMISNKTFLLNNLRKTTTWHTFSFCNTLHNHQHSPPTAHTSLNLKSRFFFSAICRH